MQIIFLAVGSLLHFKYTRTLSERYHVANHIKSRISARRALFCLLGIAIWIILAREPQTVIRLLHFKRNPTVFVCLENRLQLSQQQSVGRQNFAQTRQTLYLYCVRQWLSKYMFPQSCWASNVVLLLWAPKLFGNLLESIQTSVR